MSEEAARAAPLGGEDREALRGILGEGFRDSCSRAVDGLIPAATLRPGSRKELVATLRILSAAGLPALICGGGSRLSTGNPPRGARVLLETGALGGVRELDVEEGVVYARAGTPLATLAIAAERAGWELPVDAPTGSNASGARAGTLGGALAADAIGPRHLGQGRLRDIVLGLDVVLGDGCAVRCGGRVVKNVTGYDLNKLHIGAFGTLGVIEGAWLRLRSMPERCELLLAPLGGEDRVWDVALAVARGPAARAVAVLDAALLRDPRLGWEAVAPRLLAVELAGADELVQRERAALAESIGAVPAPDTAGAEGGVEGPATEGSGRGLEYLSALSRGAGADPPHSRALCFRIAALPSRLAATMAPLGAAGAACLVYPGSGLVYALFDAPDGDGGGEGERLAATWAAAEAAARAGAGHARLEAAPTTAKAGRDVFGAEAAEGGALHRTLKAQFDPAGILNPGRFAGGI